MKTKSIRIALVFSLLLFLLLVLSLYSVLTGVKAPAAAPDADPIIIVAGTAAPAFIYKPLARRLTEGGYRVYIYTIPKPFGPFEDSAAGLKRYLEKVLSETGAAKVDLIGHSQGVVISRYVVKFLGAESHVDTLISLAGGIYGSGLATWANDYMGCLGMPVCFKSVVGSDFMNALNTPSDSVEGIHHVNFSGKYDQVVIPYELNFMKGAGDITNVLVQDQCPKSWADHLSLIFDGAVATGIFMALEKKPVILQCDAS